MKVVILAGGFGTRISEETRLRPKPMIEIGGKPVLWHIMKIYSTYGVNDFVICCGYKGHLIKEYFASYASHTSGITFHINNNEKKTRHKDIESWNVTLVDTGLETMTGGRLKRIKKYLDNETFCLSYGDDLKNVDITKLVAFHRKKKTLATLTAFQPLGRFGMIKLQNDKVLAIKEKPKDYNIWVNGGYYVLEPEVIDYIKNDLTVWERRPLENLALKGQLSAYKYTGPYQPLDTLQDKNNLVELWNSGNAYWKIWQ